MRALACADHSARRVGRRRAAEGVVGMRITNARDLGYAIRLRRSDLGYTQAVVAGLSAVSLPFLSHLENGKETAELGKALRVADVLGIRLEAVKPNGEAL